MRKQTRKTEKTEKKKVRYRVGKTYRGFHRGNSIKLEPGKLYTLDITLLKHLQSMNWPIEEVEE